MRVLRDGPARLARRRHQVHDVQAPLRIEQHTAVEILERDVAQPGADLVARHRDVHAREAQPLPIQEVVVVDAVLEVDARDFDAPLPAGLQRRIAGRRREFRVALRAQRDGAHSGVQTGGRVRREGRDVQFRQIHRRLHGQGLRRESALQVQLAVALDARRRQREIALARPHGKAVGGHVQALQDNVQRGLEGFVARLELGEIGLHRGRGCIHRAVALAHMHLRRRAQAAVQQRDRRRAANRRRQGRQRDVAQTHAQFQRQRLQHQRPLGAQPAAVGAVVHRQPQVDGLVLYLRQGHALDRGRQARHDVVQLADRIGDVHLAFVQVEGVQRHRPFRGSRRRGRRGGCRGRTRGARHGWSSRSDGTSGSSRGRFRRRGLGGGRRGVRGSRRVRRLLCRRIQPAGLPELVRHGRGGGLDAAQLFQLGDHVQPVQMFVGVAAHVDLRRPEPNLAHIDAARDRFQFQAADGQRAPCRQALARGIAQVEPAQPQVAHDADLGRRVLGLFEHDLQVGIQQRALDLERQRHGPDVGPLFQLQAVERHPQGRRRHHVERTGHAGQVEGAAVDAQMQAGLHVDVGGVAEGRNERHAHAQLVHDLLAAGDLVVQRDGAVLDDHVVQREAGQPFVRLGRLLGLGGRQFGHPLLNIREVEPGDVLAHDGDVRLAQRQAIDDGREPEQRGPGGAGVQFGKRQQRRLRAGLGHGQVACADGQREGIERDLADGNVAADHLGDVLRQDAAQDLGDLPGCDAEEDQYECRDAQKNLADPACQPKLWHPQGHCASPDTN
ncbi:hypothetical protein D9M68_417640 [compost metagenome]